MQKRAAQGEPGILGGRTTMKTRVRKAVWLMAALGMALPACAAGNAGRLRNPYADARAYVNPHWRAHVLQEPGGAAIANASTAIWLDHIGAITGEGGSWGLADYLDDALRQQANLVTLVLYDLPNRDCAALASSGELLLSNNGFARYQQEYITPIAHILARPKYRALRIVAVIEPDSLPNLVTNLAVPRCREAAAPGGYVDGIRYTLNALYPLRNVYSYVDIAHSGWLGWEDSMNKAVALIADTIKGTEHGVASVAGFVSNTANYTPLEEPWLHPYTHAAVPNDNGLQVRQAKFYGWNARFGELDYVRAFRQKMLAQGFPDSIGMIIDTSRNGWGGLRRPSALSKATDPDDFVDESRIDRRTHRGMWCNQTGGIGERPRANPVPGVDAYVWVKPPGESDGIAVPGVPDPNDPAKKFDRFCDPTFEAPGTDGKLTGAMPGAPHAGQWFSAGFAVLLNNAWPPLK
jgi:cellulose 1,4-beta-cellobiosidase